MAAFLSVSSRPDSNKPLPNGTKSISKRRHHVSRAESRPRRPQSEQRSSRCSPPRQQSPWSQIPMTMHSVSTPSLGAPMELNRGITMERTPSGNSIMSDTPIPYDSSSSYDHTLTDEQAARRVESHFRHFPRDGKPERILHGLIRRDHGEVDDDALASILKYADQVFFDGALAGRVMWEWSDDNRYQTDLIGTTALRRCRAREGFETLIVLSEPILRSGKYDRTLLLSAFLHELVHCYLFIMCGFGARLEGGHTDGFERIVTVIDNWVGRGCLRLCNFKANLDHFVKENRGGCCQPWLETSGMNLYRHRHVHPDCNQNPPRERQIIELRGLYYNEDL